MSEYGSPIFLSQLSKSFEDQSFDPNTCNICGNGASGWSCPHHIPQYASTINHHNQALVPPQKRPRGRPNGSKNKPKPPLVITQINEEVLKPVVIEVATGLDVMEALVNFARRRNVGISVLSGSGSVANVTLRNPLPRSLSFTLHGPFTMLALTGTYICGPSPPLSLVTPTSSSFGLNPNHHPFATYTNSFEISLLGSQGEIFGGVIDGKVVAGSTVMIVAAVFKKSEFHKVGFNGNDEGGVGENDHNNPSASGGGGGNIMSGLLNPQVPSAEDDVMQWGHNYSSTLSGNY